MRTSIDADAVVALQVREAQALRQSLVEVGYEAVLSTGDVDDPIPAFFEVKDRHGNRVDLLIGLRGMDPELMNRTRACGHRSGSGVARSRTVPSAGAAIRARRVPLKTSSAPWTEASPAVTPGN